MNNKDYKINKTLLKSHKNKTMNNKDYKIKETWLRSHIEEMPFL
jgi:hypothetical protein